MTGVSVNSVLIANGVDGYCEQLYSMLQNKMAAARHNTWKTPNQRWRLITKAVRAHAISFTLKNILTDHRVLDATVEFAIASQRQLWQPQQRYTDAHETTPGSFLAPGSIAPLTWRKKPCVLEAPIKPSSSSSGLTRHHVRCSDCFTCSGILG